MCVWFYFKLSCEFLCFYLQCLNASSILSSHGMSQEGGVTLADFSYLCPALLNQIDGGACLLHGGAAAHEETGGNPLMGPLFSLCSFFLKKFCSLM